MATINDIPFKSFKGSKNNIRLLEIQPGYINDPISCRLVNAQLSPDLEFIGLSALVGDLEATEDIWISQRRIAIPANLGQALRYARAAFLAPPKEPATADGRSSSSSLSEKEKDQPRPITRGSDPAVTGTSPPSPCLLRPPRWGSRRPRRPSALFEAIRAAASRAPLLRVWVDTLCVDAADGEERAGRAATAAAYRAARTVVGWLGAPDATSDQALDAVEAFDAAMPRGFGSVAHQRAHPEHYAPHWAWLDAVDVPDRDAVRSAPADLTLDELLALPVFCAVRAFATRPYFQRPWILEELRTAAAPAFLLGDAVVSWRKVLRMNHVMEELYDRGSNSLPVEFTRSVVFFPLCTVYILLEEFNKIRDIVDQDDTTTASSAEIALRKLRIKKSVESVL